MKNYKKTHRRYKIIHNIQANDVHIRPHRPADVQHTRAWTGAAHVRSLSLPLSIPTQSFPSSAKLARPSGPVPRPPRCPSPGDSVLSSAGGRTPARRTYITHEREGFCSFPALLPSFNTKHHDHHHTSKTTMALILYLIAAAAYALACVALEIIGCIAGHILFCLRRCRKTHE